MAKHSSSTGEVPTRVATTTPDISTGNAHVRELVDKIERSIEEIKKEIRVQGSDRHSDFKYMIAVFSGGFIILAGMLIAGYFRLDNKLDSLTRRVDKLSISSIKMETKLGDLLARIPPAQTVIPKR